MTIDEILTHGKELQKNHGQHTMVSERLYYFQYKNDVSSVLPQKMLQC